MNAQKRLRLMMRSCLLVIVTALCLAACGGPAVQVPVPAQVAEKATNKDVLQTCAVLRDQDMAEIRGCYDSYYFFGMSLDASIDFAGGKPTINGNVTTMAFSNKDITGKGINNLPVGGGFSFTAGNGQVSFNSSFGRNNLGNGVIQLVQVMGNNNLVIASTNVTLYLNNLPTIKPNVTTALGSFGGLRGR